MRSVINIELNITTPFGKIYHIYLIFNIYGFPMGLCNHGYVYTYLYEYNYNADAAIIDICITILLIHLNYIQLMELE